MLGKAKSPQQQLSNQAATQPQLVGSPEPFQASRSAASSSAPDMPDQAALAASAKATQQHPAESSGGKAVHVAQQRSGSPRADSAEVILSTKAGGKGSGLGRRGIPYLLCCPLTKVREHCVLKLPWS